MESLGEKLKNARNEKNLGIEQISRETNISIRYLESLESENFDLFPGEPYVIGFLKNYSSYLELDVNKIISLYRALRIQEQPVPVEQLLKKTPKAPAFLLPALIVLFVIGAGSWGVYSLIINRRNNPVHELSTDRVPVEYLMESNSIERRLYINDSVLISTGSEIHRVELFNLSETVTIRTDNGGMENLDLSQEITLDLNNNGIPELRIMVMDFAKNNPNMGAVLHFSLLDVSASTNIQVEPEITFTTSAATASVVTIIPSSPNAYPFTLQINFTGFCMLRWEILEERDRRGINQRFFQRNETLDIQAQNLGIRIWVSNATAARFQVIGGGRTFPVEIGSAGEVVVAEIRWVRDEDGRYRVVLIRLET
ncbi:MAG: helix-turn-helix domain-containing protein [Treponema sp.]|jgi:cytoskeletal protein RodZ|nr:helix-turn-helix domain-containing protein [Treponema sp.]